MSWEKAKEELNKYLKMSVKKQDGTMKTLKETYKHLWLFLWYGKWKFLYWTIYALFFGYGIANLKKFIWATTNYHIKFIQIFAIIVVMRFMFHD